MFVSDKVVLTCYIFWLHWKEGNFVIGFNREFQS